MPRLQKTKPIEEKRENKDIWDKVRDEAWGLNNEAEEVAEKTFTKEEIEKITTAELKVLGIRSLKDRTMREQITRNVIMAVETAVQKSEEAVE